MRVFQWTINVLPLMTLSTMIYVARSLISHWFLLFWPFNNIEMMKNLAVNYECFFILSIGINFPHNYQKLFVLVILNLPFTVHSKEWNKEERWQTKVSWSLKTFLGKDRRNLFLFQFRDSSFYLHQKSKTKIVVQIDIHNLLDIFHRFQGGKNIGCKIFFPNHLLWGFY